MRGSSGRRAREVNDIAVIASVCGALSGAVSGAVVGWLIAPTRAEREERGRKRIAGREAIAAAIRKFRYGVSETRQRLYRKNEVNVDEFEGAAVEFAANIRRGALPLRRLERFRLYLTLRMMVGPGILRLVELRPPDRHSASADSAQLQAIADTRPWAARAAFSSDLVKLRPTDQKWDLLLKRLSRMQKRYP